MPFWVPKICQALRPTLTPSWLIYTVYKGDGSFILSLLILKLKGWGRPQTSSHTDDPISLPRVGPVKVEGSYTRSSLQRSQLHPCHHLTGSQNLLAFFPGAQSVCEFYFLSSVCQFPAHMAHNTLHSNAEAGGSRSSCQCGGIREKCRQDSQLSSQLCSMHSWPPSFHGSV